MPRNKKQVNKEKQTKTAESDHNCFTTANNITIVPLILSLSEISRDNYQEKYGKDSLTFDPVTSAASNLAKVTLNNYAFAEGYLNKDDLISIKSFENKEYIITVENVNSINKTFSIIGKVNKTDYGYLNLSVANNLVLASLELTELNAIYLLRYNHLSGSYYLFKAPYDKIEKPARY